MYSKRKIGIRYIVRQMTDEMLLDSKHSGSTLSNDSMDTEIYESSERKGNY